jgi:hypothetical protein
VGGGTGSLSLPSTYFTSNFFNGFSGITVGNNTAGDITVDSIIYRDPLTLKTAGNIVVNANATIVASPGVNSLTLWADSEGNNNGSIWLKGNNTITTNGGHLWMGGGAIDTSWNGLTVGGDGSTPGYAVGNGTNSNGIEINGSTTINTAGGSIALYGKSRNGAAVVSNADGIWFNGTNISVNSGVGSILLDGVSQATSGQVGIGVEFFQATHSVTSAATSGDAITIRGSGTTAAMTYTEGVFLHASEGLSAIGGGNISITGIGGGGTNKEGIYFEDATTSIANAGAGNLSLIADSMFASGRFSGTGSLTVRPYTVSTTIGVGTGPGTLSLPSSFFTSYFADGFSGITVGSVNSGDITVGATTLTYKDPLTLKSARNIQFSGATVISSAGSNPLVLWSDADGNNDGYIGLNSSSIATNDGHLWMGGGSGSTNWKGLAVGNGSAVNPAAGGNGITLTSSTVSTGAGDIYMNGKSTNTTTAHSDGIDIDYITGTAIQLTTGNIVLIGTAGTSINNDGIRINGSIASTSGSISLTGYGSGGTSSEAVSVDQASISSTSGNISLNSDTFWMSTTNASIASGGALTIAPTSTNLPIGVGITGGLSIDTAYFNSAGKGFVNGFSDITIGNATAGNITAGSATTLNDNTTFITGGNIAINAALNASGQTVALTGGSGKTVSGNGDITADKLLLNGSDTTYALNAATGNSVSTLAASTGSGNVSFYNNAALTIGTVGSTSGIATTGTVDVETFTGDLTLAQNISTTGAPAAAVILNAGRNAAALTATGGNIIISGSPTIGTGSFGVAQLYTGSVVNSTGLTSFIGSGSGRFRYASDEATTNYTAPLVAGNNAIYRESFDIKVTPAAYFSTYGDAVAPTAFVVNTGNLQNGDSLTGTISATITSTGGPTSPVGGYLLTADLGLLPLRNSLGYNLVGVVNPGAHTISQRPISVTAVDQSRTYGSANPSTGAVTLTSGTTVNGDTLSTATLNSTATNTTAAGATAPLTPSSQTFSAGAAGNYNITYVDGTLTINTATATISATKPYDGNRNITIGNISISGVNGETLFLSGIGTATIASKDVAENATNYIDNFNGLSIGSGTGLASNYRLPNTSRSANNGVTLNPKTVSLSANKIYDGTTNLSGFVAINTGIANETLSYSGATSNDPNVTTVNKFINAITLANGTGGIASNYQLPTLDYLNAPVTIIKANLTVTADDKSRLYGEANPPLTTTVSGFVNSENTTTALGFGGTGTATTTATSTSNVGQATITSSVGTLIAANYDFVPVNGTLTIQPIQSAVFTPPPPPRVDLRPLGTPQTDPKPIAGWMDSATGAAAVDRAGQPCNEREFQKNKRCAPAK